MSPGRRDGRNTERVAKAVGTSAGLLVVKLDVTKSADAEAAARATIERFGRIDVLANNAASFYAGNFEELSQQQMDLQLATSLVGPMNVTRAFLPVMRKQRSGKIISISSTAELMGFEFCSAYSASKFGLDGWMEGLQAEVAPFGIQTMIVNPGFFRTELLTKESTQYAALSVDDYRERREQQEQFWTSQNGKRAATRLSSLARKNFAETVAVALPPEGHLDPHLGTQGLATTKATRHPL